MTLHWQVPGLRILGVDPGAKTGWALYNGETRRVLERGTFEGHVIDPAFEAAAGLAGIVAVERPRGYGPTYPQVVDAAYVCGRIVGSLIAKGRRVAEIERREIRSILSDTTNGCVRVKNDATCWAALKFLHGEACDKKGGALHGVRAHERAALAACVAWCLSQRSEQQQGANAC